MALELRNFGTAGFLFLVSGRILNEHVVSASSVEIPSLHRKLQSNNNNSKELLQCLKNTTMSDKKQKNYFHDAQRNQCQGLTFHDHAIQMMSCCHSTLITFMTLLFQLFCYRPMPVSRITMVYGELVVALQALIHPRGISKCNQCFYAVVISLHFHFTC